MAPTALMDIPLGFFAQETVGWIVDNIYISSKTCNRRAIRDLIILFPKEGER